MAIKGIKAPEWAKKLNEVKRPDQDLQPIDPKKYLATPKEEKSKKLTDRTLKVVTAEELKTGKYQKLSLAQITWISTQLLNNNKRQPISLDDKVAIGEGITQVAKAKQQKMKEHRISRGVLRFLAYLLHAVVVGRFLLNYLNRPEKEIQTANEISQRYNQYFEDFKGRVSQQNDTDLSEIGITLGQVLNREIEGADLKEPLGAFKGDNLRSVLHMIVKDSDITEDYKRDPNEEMSMEDRAYFVTNQFAHFDALVGDDDKKWVALLQLVFSQQTETQLCGSLVGTSRSLNDIKTMADDRYEFRSPNPVEIRVTIERDAAKKIKKLHIEAKTTSSFFHVMQDNPQGSPPVTIKDEKIEGKDIASTLHFDVTLNDQNKPEFNVTKYHHEML